MGDGGGERVLEGLLAGGGGLLALAGGGEEEGGGVLAAGGDRPISAADFAKHFDVTPRQVYRLIARGMDTSSLDAGNAWRKASRKLPPQMQAGFVKRVRQEGELPAKQFADALGVSAPRVSQLWSEGMSRTSVEDAMAWRARNRRCSVAVSDVSDDSTGDLSSDSASSSDADLLELAGVTDATDLLACYTRSRNLSGEHSVCPQLMDFCLAGVECWGHFYTSFRPFEPKLMTFEPFVPVGGGGKLHARRLPAAGAGDL